MSFYRTFPFVIKNYNFFSLGWNTVPGNNASAKVSFLHPSNYKVQVSNKFKYVI